MRMPKIKKGEKVGDDGKKVVFYWFRYLDKTKPGKNGKPSHRQESFDKRKEAEARASVVYNEFHKGVLTSAGAKVTVGQLLDTFYKSAEDRVSDGRMGRSKFAQIRQTVNSIEPVIGSVKLADLSVNDIERVYSKLVKQDGIEPFTAKVRITVLGQILDFAGKRDLVSKNVARDGLKDLKGIQVKPVRDFKIDEVSALFATLEKKTPRMARRSHLMLRIFVYLASSCAMRWGEIAGLKEEHIDLDRRVLKVRHTWTRWGVLHPPKTAAGNRDIPIPRPIVPLLREWIERHAVSNEMGLLFCGTVSRVGISSGRFHTEYWIPLLERAGLANESDQFHFHALRHFAASRWIGAGMPLPDVAKLMGHAKVNMVLKVYAHAMTSTSYQDRLLDDVASHLIVPPGRSASDLHVAP